MLDLRLALTESHFQGRSSSRAQHYLINLICHFYINLKMKDKYQIWLMWFDLIFNLGLKFLFGSDPKFLFFSLM